MSDRHDKSKQGVVSVSSPKQFGDLLDIIHDECFELDEIRYDPSDKSVEIPYRRIFHRGPRRVLKNRWFYRVEEVDVLRNILRVRKVESMKIKDEAEIGSYSFNDLTYDDSTSELVFTCCAPCELRIRVSDIDIESEELGYRGKAQITSGFFGDFNTSKVYE